MKKNKKQKDYKPSFKKCLPIRDTDIVEYLIWKVYRKLQIMNQVPIDLQNQY